ncbi:hypothetical protein ACJX0J_035625 [Zea mays]
MNYKQWRSGTRLASLLSLPFSVFFTLEGCNYFVDTSCTHAYCIVVFCDHQPSHLVEAAAARLSIEMTITKGIKGNTVIYELKWEAQIIPKELGGAYKFFMDAALFSLPYNCTCAFLAQDLSWPNNLKIIFQ